MNFMFIFKVLLTVTFVVGCLVAVNAQTTAFVGVSVIPMDRERVLANQTVIVKNGVIAKIGDTETTKIPLNAKRIDARGKYMIPGLVDMHVHLTLATSQAFPVLVANGVTTVRDMGGELKKIDEWRGRINSRRMIGPQIFRAGPYVDGPKDAPDRLVIKTEQDAIKAVRFLKAQKVDFIKVHNAVPREALFPLLRAAKKVGLKVAGHIPLTVTPFEAVNSGFSCIEHMTSLIEGAATAAAKAGKSTAEAVAAFDDKAAGSLFNSMAKNGACMTPNLVGEKAITFRAEIEATPDPRARYVAASLRKYWYQAFTAKPTAARKLLLNRYFELVRSMRSKHVQILAGTDLGLRDIYPGFSLHDELGLLAGSGLTAFEAIRSATVEAANWLSASRLFGLVKEGQRADLVLLSADPLKDIENIRRIDGVVLRGRYFPKAELEKMLSDAAAAADVN